MKEKERPIVEGVSEWERMNAKERGLKNARLGKRTKVRKLSKKKHTHTR